MEKEEIIEKYGDLEMKFDYYYKYCFSFKTEKDGLIFKGLIGGDAGRIYKEEITPETIKLVKDFDWELDYFSIEKDNKNIFIFDNL